MRVLAIDSAMNGCQACVCDITRGVSEQLILAQEKLEMAKGQAEQLMPMIERVIKNSGISYSALDIIGVTNGPGAFTGMRIAIATAKAIAIAADKPVIGVSTIDAVLDGCMKKLTQNEGWHPYYAVVLETKRKDYYFQMFEVDKEAELVLPATGAVVAGASEISAIISTNDVLFVGDAVERLKNECSQNWPSYVVTIPDGSSVAELAVINYLDNGKKCGCEPVYLRGAEIGKAKAIPRTIRNKQHL